MPSESRERRLGLSSREVLGLAALAQMGMKARCCDNSPSCFSRASCHGATGHEQSTFSHRFGLPPGPASALHPRPRRPGSGQPGLCQRSAGDGPTRAPGGRAGRRVCSRAGRRGLLRRRPDGQRHRRSPPRLAGAAGPSRLRRTHEAFAGQDRLRRRTPPGRPGPHRVPPGRLAGAASGAAAAPARGPPPVARRPTPDSEAAGGAILREYRVKIEALEPGRAPGRWSRPWVLRVRDNGRLPEHVRWIVGEKLDEIEHVGTRVARVEGRLRQATAGDATVARPWPDCGRSRASER